jgi:signal recognition particle GTPase
VVFREIKMGKWVLNTTNMTTPPQSNKSLKKNGLSQPPKVHYFAYMRRSTTKEEQSESLIQQEEGVKTIAQGIGVSLTEIHPFTESRSGFENRYRCALGKG